MKSLKSFTAAFICVFLFSCATKIQNDPAIYEMLEKDYYTTCNLHANPKTGDVYSINYQFPDALIPWGTKVKLLDVTRGRATLEIAPGKTFNYYFDHRTVAAEKRSTNLKSFLSQDIQKLREEVDRMSEIDKKGIKRGVILKGMSKKAVILAAGLPPGFANPDPMKSSVWNYWDNSSSQFLVYFDDKGKVKEII